MGNSMPAPAEDSKLYELRSYKLATQDSAKFKALACANLPVRMQRSRLVGVWETAIGDINHVLHMWEYDSLNHWKAVRDEMASHADWMAFEERVSPMIKRMESCLCRSLLGDLSAVWSDKDFYKITTARNVGNWSGGADFRSFMWRVDYLRKAGSRTVVMAALETVIGNGREFILIESSKDLQNLVPTASDRGLFVIYSSETEILYPYPWSQWAAMS